MKSIVIQFHAKLVEVLELVDQVRAEFGLHAVVMTLSPFRVMALATGDRLAENFINEFRGKSDLRIALNVSETNVNVKSPNEFLDVNPGTIVFDLGSETPETLGESALMFRSSVEPAVKVANEVAKKLKKITYSGVVAVNPDSRAECTDKSHRYTLGAKQHFQGGGKLLPVAGKSVLEIR